MKTFQDYINFKEISAYDIGTSVMGRTTLDDDSEKALTAAFQAFEIIMAKNSQAAIQLLLRYERWPEIQELLRQHGLDSFQDLNFRSDMRKGAGKGRKYISKGLGDVTPDDVKSSDVDVIAANAADSFHNPIG